MSLPLQYFILVVHRFVVGTPAYALLLVDAYPSFAEGAQPAASGGSDMTAPARRLVGVRSRQRSSAAGS